MTRDGMGVSAVALLLALVVQSSLQQGTGPGPEQRKPFFERFRRLEEQVRRFQEVTLNRLQGIAENYNISYNIDAQFQHLTEQYRVLSSTVEASRATVQNDLSSLKVWMKKLQRKHKKLELKVSALEQALGDRTKQSSREKKEQSVVLSNLTQELVIHKQDISSLTSGRSKLEKELEKVQDAIQGHGALISTIEERLKHAVQNEVLSLSSLPAAELPNETPQGKHLGSVGAEQEDKPEQSQSAKKLQTKHRQRKRLQERYQQLIPAQVDKLINNHREDNEAGHQQVEMAAELPSDKSLHQPQEKVEPQALRQAGESIQGPLGTEKLQGPAKTPVSAETTVHRMLEKSMPEKHVPAELRATRKPQGPAVSEEREPANSAQATICNVDSMLVFPSASTENVAFFTPGFQAEIHEVSICSWVKTGASYLGTILSYATEENDNKLVLHGRNTTNQGTVHLVIGDPAFRELPVLALLDNRWHHICVIWSSIQGRYWYYVDRRLVSTGSRFQKGYELPPGGSLVLGQEQDTTGGGFDSSEAFVGSLAGFSVWNRALSPGEVSAIATGKVRPRGAILTMGDISSIHGFVQRVNCTCLEHCI